MPNDKEFELDDLESFSFDDLSLDEEPAAVEANPGEDPFGVWVKSAPEDIDSEMDPLAEAELPEEDFLSSEELANLDDSFDIVTVDEPLDGESPLEDEMAFLDTPEALDAEASTMEMPSIEEVSLDDFVDLESEPLPDLTLETPALTPATQMSGSDDAMDEEFLDIDMEMDESLSDADLEMETEDFGDFQEVTPVEPTVEAMNLDNEDFFEEDVPEANETLNLEPDDHTDMDHLIALEEDLTSAIRVPEVETVEAAPKDLAAMILEKIEQELSSIKQEITELKREVTHLRFVPEAPALVPAAPLPPEPEETPAEAAHGFFDEEDDETIALTGDELDNILSTAEISEGEEDGITLEEDLLALDTEGNLIEPEETLEETDHVTDEDFLAGTSLDLNEPDPFEDLGIPQGIELEDTLPEELEGNETEDLLLESTQDIEVAPLPEGLLEANEPPLEIPFDDDIGLELELDSLPPLETDPEGWSPADMVAEEPAAPATPPAPSMPILPVETLESGKIPAGLKEELRSVLSYMDKLLASLPDDKIQEFAESEHFEVYKRLFEELGLIE